MPKPIRHLRSKAANMMAVAQLASLLIPGTRSMQELAELTGLNLNTVQRWCAALHNTGAAYVSGWRIDTRGAYSTRLYKLGEGVDKLAPIKTTKAIAQRDREYRAAVKANKPYRQYIDIEAL